MATLHLEIVTIERRVYDDEVNMVVAPGSEGMLGILPRHTPLLTALTYGELQIKKDGQEDQFFAIGGGFMEVQPNRVVVLADSAERAEEIDVERAEAARRRAEESIAKAPEELELERAEAALRRNVTRLKVAERRRGARARSMRGPGDGMS
ncbi:MAG: F0F1 ATP synthase subunit epsilon [Anaerolineae bacterium]|nr:F0F1 ATP synthase subunit epsilon [Anaerolineales bacterium]MCQ3975781.1 F0F1 ATP synthase subunit epsilon [Anaerolineae bacterium]